MYSFVFEGFSWNYFPNFVSSLYVGGGDTNELIVRPIGGLQFVYGHIFNRNYRKWPNTKQIVYLSI